MGGYGTWELAVKYPDKFAAIVPICGGGNQSWLTELATYSSGFFMGRSIT